MADEKRLIDANELGSFTFHIMCEEEDGEAFERCVVDWDDIETAPTVDAAEVVHGGWIEKPYLLGTTRYCSICGQNYGMPHGVFNYCPNCGAAMDGGADNGI